MSVRHVTAVWRYAESAELTSGELLVLLCIADYSNRDDGLAWPSHATIGRRCQIDTRSVRRIIARLERRDALERLVQAAPAGADGQRTNVYRLTLGEDPSVRPWGGPKRPRGEDRNGQRGRTPAPSEPRDEPRDEPRAPKRRTAKDRAADAIALQREQENRP